MTVIPYGAETNTARINELIRQIAAQGKLALFDIYPSYAAELQKGPNMLNYRRYPLAKVPPSLQSFARPYIFPGTDPQIIVLDNRLDAHFGHLPGWFDDRHPNLAGCHLIAAETAKFLAPLIRERINGN